MPLFSRKPKKPLLVMSPAVRKLLDENPKIKKTALLFWLYINEHRDSASRDHTKYYPSNETVFELIQKFPEGESKFYISLHMLKELIEKNTPSKMYSELLKDFEFLNWLERIAKIKPNGVTFSIYIKAAITSVCRHEYRH